MISRLHLVTDDRVLSRPGLVADAGASFSSGEGRITFHLRGPRTSGRKLWDLALKLRQIARSHGVPLIVNDRVDLALALGVEGAQLGTRSLPVPDARRVLGPEAMVGRSIHGVDEALQLVDGGGELAGAPDFLVIGALFATPSHPDRSPVGSETVRAVNAAIPAIPLVGIGGVTPVRIREILASGAYGVAVVRAVWDAPDPAAAVCELLEELERCVSPQNAVQSMTRRG